MCAVKISAHGALRCTALPVRTSLHRTLTLHGDEMTHGCHFGYRGDKPGAGEQAILTPSPTGAGPPAFGLLPGPTPRHSHSEGVQKELLNGWVLQQRLYTATGPSWPAQGHGPGAVALTRPGYSYTATSQLIWLAQGHGPSTRTLEFGSQAQTEV